jgi:subtilisin family serine protease
MRIGLACSAVLLLLSVETFASERYLIRFKPKLQRAQIASVLSRFDIQVRREFPEIQVFAVEAKNFSKLEEAKFALKESILYVERDSKIFVNATPNDSGFKQQSSIRQANIEKAWDITTGSQKVLIAVSDTGFSFDHEELKSKVWTNRGETGPWTSPTSDNESADSCRDKSCNKIDDDGNGFVDDVHGWNFIRNDNDPDDNHGHGTHVSGIIGAETNNRRGVAGINWNVTILPVQAFGADGSGSTSDGMASILYAVNQGARLVNCSWSGPGYSQAFFELINYVYSKGALIIAAAGNSGASIDVQPTYPAAFRSLGVIAVAASETKGNLATFTNVGRFTVGLAAPGYKILSALPHGYDSWSGTSMAAPMVAGAGGLILSLAPELSALELRNALLNATDTVKDYELITTGGDLNFFKAVEQLSRGFQVWPKRYTIEVGHSYTYSAFGAEGAVTWKATPENIATVDAEGNVTGLAPGNVVVTATDSLGKVAAIENLTVSESIFSGGCKSDLAMKHRAAGDQAEAALSMGLPFFAGLLGWSRRRFRRERSLN